MDKIKLKLISDRHSLNRGIGNYASHLTTNLSKNPAIKLVHQDPDIIHYTYFDLFYPTLPFKKKAPTVVTIHDLTPLVLSRLYPKGLKGTVNLLKQRLSLFNVPAVITDSENSRRDLIKIFFLSPEKVFVVPLASNKIFKNPPSPISVGKIKSKFNLPDKFVLTVAGGPNPNKNLPLLAEVTKDLKISLVIVGGDVAKDLPLGRLHKELQDLKLLKTYSHLLTPGFITNRELLAFYSLATLYCQPSLYEGFGLPLLEAMHVGCLIVSSNTGSLPEIYPPSTITFDPHRKESLSNALQKALNLTEAEKTSLIRKAQKTTKQFTWKTTIQKTIDIYSRVLSS